MECFPKGIAAGRACWKNSHLIRGFSEMSSPERRFDIAYSSGGNGPAAGAMSARAFANTAMWGTILRPIGRIPPPDLPRSARRMAHPASLRMWPVTAFGEWEAIFWR